MLFEEVGVPDKVLVYRGRVSLVQGVKVGVLLEAVRSLVKRWQCLKGIESVTRVLRLLYTVQ